MESFFQGWVARQELFLGELLSAPRDNPERHLAAHRDLVVRVLLHYREYYQEKARVAVRDVLSLFSPPWLTTLERTFLWVAGWKPSLAFRLLSGAVEGLSPEQSREAAELRREAAAEEQVLGAELAHVQEGMAMPQMLALMRAAPRNGEAGTEAMEAVLASLEHLVASADALRARIVTKLVEILTPLQSVDFLAAAGKMHLRVRGWSVRRDRRAGAA